MQYQSENGEEPNQIDRIRFFFYPLLSQIVKRSIETTVVKINSYHAHYRIIVTFVTGFSMGMERSEMTKNKSRNGAQRNDDFTYLVAPMLVGYNTATMAPYNPPSTVTISNENGILVVVRKPDKHNAIKQYFGCFGCCSLLAMLSIFCVAMSFNHIYRTEGAEQAHDFLVAVIVVAAMILLAIVICVVRDRCKRIIHPPDYEDEIITFDSDKFTIQYRGVMSSFSYRFDAKPVIYQYSNSEDVNFIIPCSPLEDYVHAELYEESGCYVMRFIKSTDAKRILTAFKEHLEAISAKRVTG